MPGVSWTRSLLSAGWVSVRGWLLVVLVVGGGRAEHARGNCEGGVAERDLDVVVTVGASLDDRQAPRILSASAECSPAALGGCGVLWMGLPLFPV
jgi:hypothetical protein